VGSFPGTQAAAAAITAELPTRSSLTICGRRYCRDEFARLAWPYMVITGRPRAAARTKGRHGMPIAELATFPMWYDERGDGDPLVLLHPGGAGVDSRALAPNLEALSRLLRT
jgi:hypothetical protein